MPTGRAESCSFREYDTSLPGRPHPVRGSSTSSYTRKKSYVARCSARLAESPSDGSRPRSGAITPKREDKGRGRGRSDLSSREGSIFPRAVRVAGKPADGLARRFDAASRLGCRSSLGPPGPLRALHIHQVRISPPPAHKRTQCTEASPASPANAAARVARARARPRHQHGSGSQRLATTPTTRP